MACRYLYAMTTDGEPPAEGAPTHLGGWRFNVKAQLRADREGINIYTFRRNANTELWACHKVFEPNPERSTAGKRKTAITASVKALRQAADNIEASIDDFRSGDAIDDNGYEALEAIAKIMPDGAWLRKQLNVDYLLEPTACQKCGVELSPDGECHDCDRIEGQRLCQVAPDTGNQDV